MDGREFRAEVQQRLRRQFVAMKLGQSVPPEMRHRLEGFIQAGVYLDLVSNADMSAMMRATYQEVFGASIEARRSVGLGVWDGQSMDYSVYERPAYERQGA